MTMTTQEAWLWRGGDEPTALTLETSEIPPLAADDILIRNHAIGLNPVDWKVLDMKMGSIPGVDGAGVIEAVGDRVDPTWIGRRVAYHQSLSRAGSFAQYTAIQAQTAMRLPDTQSFVSAAAIPCPALTAWQSLDKIPVKANKPVLISGAGGSVGHYLVQMAVQRGFTVSVIAHSRHWERLTGFGAVACFDDREQNMNHLQHSFYAVIDSRSEQSAMQLASLLCANGHLVAIQGRTNQWPSQPFGPSWSMHEVALGALHRFGNPQDWLELTRAGETILDQVSEGILKPDTIITADFHSLPQQLMALKHRSASGKFVITC